MRFDFHWIARKYGIGIIAVVGIVVWTLATVFITRAIVRNNTIKELDSTYKSKYDNQLAEYKAQQAEEVQRQHWLSGEASLENTINQEADDLCRGGLVWTTDEAYFGYCCNVWVRVLRPDYPNSVAEVLRQTGQYDFFNPNAPIDEGRRTKTVELLRKLHSGILPAHLTLEHQYLEMKDDGAVCVLHTTYDHRGNDDPWRYKD